MSRPESERHEHRPEARAELFSSRGQGQTEDEYLELLEACVRCAKPARALELGTYLGDGALAILRGMGRNGFGHLDTVETQAASLAKACARLSGWDGLKHLPGRPTWEPRHMSGAEWLSTAPAPYQLAFLDCDLAGRLSALCALAGGLMDPGGLVLIHDTSELRLQHPEQACTFRSALSAVAGRCGMQRLDFPLSRGLTLLRLRGAA